MPLTIWNSSICVRAGRKAVGWFYHSLIYAAVLALRRSYAQSGFHRAVEKYVYGESALTKSFYARADAFFHRLAAKSGTLLSPSWNGSIFVRACRTAVLLVSRLTKNSFLFGFLRKAGLRGLLIIAFSLYLPLDFVVRSFGSGLSFLGFWDEAFLLFAAGYVILRRVKGHAARKTSVTPLDLPLLFFFAVTFFLMCVNAPNTGIALAGFRATSQYVIWFFLLTRLFETDRDLWFFYGTMAALGTFMGLLGCAQYVLAVPIPSTWVNISEASVRTRVFGLTTSPNIMGSFMVMCAPLTAALMYIAKKPLYKFAALCATGSMCLALVFSFSRGAWIGMLVAVVVFAVMCDRRLIGLLLGIAPLAFVVPAIANRIAFLFTPEFRVASAAGGRGIRWEIGMELFSQNKLFGFGLGRFGGAVAMQNQVIESADGFEYFYLDNYYLKTLVETGILGIIAFVFALLVIILFGFKAGMKSRGTGAHFMAGGLLAGLCGVMTHMFTENILEVPYMNAYFWAFAAALAYIGYLKGKSGNELRL